MAENLELKQIGKIVFWNTIYGFIQQNDNSSIFFHKSDVLIEKNENLELLNEVSYNISTVEKGRYKGKLVATEVVKEKDENLSEYKRYIGRLTKWNNRFGYIKSPQQQQTVLFYKTRGLYKNSIYKDGDLVVFHQVKSTKDLDQLFVLFAYPISNEKNIDFLQQQYLDSGIDEIRNYIFNLIAKYAGLTTEEKFKKFLDLIGFVDNQKAFLDLVYYIKEYRKQNYIPGYELLKDYCIAEYLIQLLETDLINGYDLDILKPYFHNVIADKKRTLILKVQSEDKKEILSYHFENLKSERKLQRLNNRIKTLLDIVYRNEESREIEIYNTIKHYLVQNLLQEELINLWLGGYIDYLPEQYIIENLDINNHYIIQSLLEKEGEKYKEVLKKVYENYFLKLTKNNFEEELPQLVKRLIIFEKEYESRYREIIAVIRNILDDDQIFVLWVFDVSIEFDAQDYFEKNYQKINDYYKIRFFLHKTTDTEQGMVLYLLEKADITKEGLLQFVSSNPWNSLLSPTEISPPDSGAFFIPDIKRFSSIFNLSNIDIEGISLHIFNAIPKYQVHHLRLWLYKYVGQKLYDYIGFREAFKELTSREQSFFKWKGDWKDKEINVTDPEISEVEPCENIISVTNKTIVYQAFLYNIYFSDGYIELRLRKKDKEYTEKYDEPYASTGLNRIPKSDSLSTIPIEIEVSKEENKIIGLQGLDKIFTQVHVGYIQKALYPDTNGKPHVPDEENNPYVEDWELRKKILDFLNTNQYGRREPKAVYENVGKIYRRKDKHSDNYKGELTRLYSIETKNGFGIVWENIDLTEDKATYIFKTKRQNLEAQLEKIADFVSAERFRSTLISTSVMSYVI